MKSILSSLCLILLTASALATAKPNIILIYTDDQGFGDASCLNPNAKFETPHLDRLAKEGISFTNGHCGDTVCTPSRYALLTGRYSWRTQLKVGVYGADYDCLIEDGRATIASLLRDNGYNTAMVGKWHLGMQLPGTFGKRDWTQPVLDMPLDKGFDYFYGIPASLNYGGLAWFEGRYAKTPPTLYTAKKSNQRHMDYRIMPSYQKTAEDAERATGNKAIEVAPDFIDNQCLTRFTDKAIEWMKGKEEDTKKGKPFFVYLPYTSPHYPVAPLPKFWGQGEAGGYGEFMIETDYHVGRVLEYLEKSGLDENTMVIFSSDNGPEKSWEQRIEEFDHDSSSLYRGGKRDEYEGGHRVPFFVRWPAGIKKPGRSNDDVVGQVDLLATIADIVGGEIPNTNGEDSISFARIFKKPNATHTREPLVNHGNSGRFTITEGKWKLLMAHKKNEKELFDLSKDPIEERNVIEENTAVASALEKKLTQIVLKGRTNEGPPQRNARDRRAKATDVKNGDWWADLTWISAADYAAKHGK